MILPWDVRLVLYKTISKIKISCKEFPVPPELSWIRKNEMAGFDCFLDPSIDCECINCKTVLAKMNEDITCFEERLDSNEKRAIELMDVVLPFNPIVELPPMMHDVFVTANAVP